VWEFYDQSRALKRAADLIHANGLAKGEYENGNTRCLICTIRVSLQQSGSLLRGDITPKDFSDFLVTLAEFLCPERYEMLVGFGSPYPARDALIWWNDSPSTTAAGAEEKLSALATILKEKGESQEA
jgi:hypothetical protein